MDSVLVAFPSLSKRNIEKQVCLVDIHHCCEEARLS
jgi:hypothetical protein